MFQFLMRLTLPVHEEINVDNISIAIENNYKNYQNVNSNLLSNSLIGCIITRQ